VFVEVAEVARVQPAVTDDGPLAPPPLGEVSTGHRRTADLDRPDVSRWTGPGVVVDDANLHARHRKTHRDHPARVGSGVRRGQRAFLQIVTTDPVHIDLW
jgi:hypothetical protein